MDLLSLWFELVSGRWTLSWVRFDAVRRFLSPLAHWKWICTCCGRQSHFVGRAHWHQVDVSERTRERSARSDRRPSSAAPADGMQVALERAARRPLL